MLPFDKLPVGCMAIAMIIMSRQSSSNISSCIHSCLHCVIVRQTLSHFAVCDMHSLLWQNLCFSGLNRGEYCCSHMHTTWGTDVNTGKACKLKMLSENMNLIANRSSLLNKLPHVTVWYEIQQVPLEEQKVVKKTKHKFICTDSYTNESKVQSQRNIVLTQ